MIGYEWELLVLYVGEHAVLCVSGYSGRRRTILTPFHPHTLTPSHHHHRRARQQQTTAIQEQHFYLVRGGGEEGKREREREGEEKK